MRNLLFTVVVLLLSTDLYGQSLSSIFNNVDTLYLNGGVPSAMEISDTSTIPLISSNPCENPREDIALARIYGNGRVIAIAHENILKNNCITQVDNADLVVNMLDWLDQGSQRITLKEGWLDSASTTDFQSIVSSHGYTFSTLSSAITSTVLSTTDILILGNDWNATTSYSSATLSLLDSFVSGGGAILILGLGWSWPQSLSNYPMHQVATLFGMQFTTAPVYDPNQNINNSPLFYNFYPDNINNTGTPSCVSYAFGTNIARGDSLRVMRIAVSSTGLHTMQNGGSLNIPYLIEDWLADINKVYGREYCMYFELIPDNYLLTFPDSSNDPWGPIPDGSSGCEYATMIHDYQEFVVDYIIGAGNYDISHVIEGTVLSGGCAANLTRGHSGGLDLPVTRHEIGHQFTQLHTIGNVGNNNYEPENGSYSIQGGNAHPHAHAQSYHELAEYLLHGIPDVGTKIPTYNTIPTADAGPDVYIPISTPFTLTAQSTDPDIDDTLTYVWDNMNRGPAQPIPVIDDTRGALFMRLLPDTSPTRTIPEISTILDGLLQNAQEQLPSQPRTMDIRLTVNDNHQILHQNIYINASGINSDDIRITVAEAGPFQVTSQNSAGTRYDGGTSIPIHWDVNGTDTIPIMTTSVSIDLSVDGGMTFPYSLSAQTPNTGTATVTLPNINTQNARIRISANNSIYFDINNADFRIDEVQDIDMVDPSLRFSVYPTPFEDYIDVYTPEHSASSRLILSDIYGRVLITRSILQDETRIDLQDLAPGSYVLTYTTGAQSRSRIISRLD